MATTPTNVVEREDLSWLDDRAGSGLGYGIDEVVLVVALPYGECVDGAQAECQCLQHGEGFEELHGG